MKQITIDLSDELEQLLNEYCQAQGTISSLSTVVETALQQYLAERGYLSSLQPLKITSAKHGSGKNDVSVNHNPY